MNDIGGAFAEAVISGPMLVAAGVAVLAGIVSFASPCVLPLVPGYVGYLGGVTGAEGPRVTRRVLAGTSLFVLGFTAVFVLLGVLFGTAGARLAPHMDLITRILGALVIVMGVAFLGHIPFLQKDTRVTFSPRFGLAGAPLLGAAFGLGWTPCIGPTLAAVLSLSFGGGSPLRGGLLALAYCIGLGLPFVGIAVAFTRSGRALAWVKRHRRAITTAGGWVLIVLGVLMVTGLWGELMARLQGLVATTGTVI